MSLYPNRSIVARLIAKDLQLNRRAVFWILLGSLTGLALTAVPGQAAMIGITLILNVFIGLLFYLPLSTVLGEVSERTLPFVMTLPVAPADYTTAKVASNLLVYLIPLTAVALGAGLVLDRSPVLAQEIPGGLVAIVLGVFLFAFCAVLAFAIASRSTGWTVGLIVVLMFVGGNLVTIVLPRVPLLRGFVDRGIAGGGELYVILATQLLAALTLLSVVAVREVRRSTFV